MPIKKLNHLLLLFLLAGAMRSAGAEESTWPEAIVTRQSTFTIPYDLPEGANAAQLASEVQLHVSSDLGASWQIAQQITPDAGQFEFQSPADGEHWFAIRTVDAQGKLRPSTPPFPEMRVIVDSTAPDIRLSAQRVGPRVVAVRWHVSDPHLAMETLSVRYQVDAAGPIWKNVQGAAAGGTTAGAYEEGQGHVAVEAEQAILLRVEVDDELGNHAVKELRLEADPALRQTAALPVTPPPSHSAAARKQADERQEASVNSRQFELEYQVDHLDGAGVGSVEIWGTRNDGRDWVRLGVDEDRRSPCPVVVDRDGLYGFTIVVSSANGLRGDAPRPGSKPDAWVRVDTARPQVKLTTAEQALDDAGPTLLVRWQAQDANRADGPVQLLYSTAPQGPWIPLATDLENTGEHLCRLVSDVPEHVYLKVEVRDAAGNLGQFATTRPVRIERSTAPSYATTHEGTTPVRSARLLHILR